VLWTARLTNACFGMQLPPLHVGMYLVGLRSWTAAGARLTSRLQEGGLAHHVRPMSSAESEKDPSLASSHGSMLEAFSFPTTANVVCRRQN
jgi:hypothetical protein